MSTLNPVAGDVVTAQPYYSSIRDRIINEAIRRDIAVTVPSVIVAATQPTAAAFNTYVSALHALNTQGTGFTFPSYKVAGVSVITASEANMLSVTLAALEAETLRCTFPRDTNVSVSTYVGNNGTGTAVVRVNSNNTVTIVSATQYNQYCGSGNHTLGVGDTGLSASPTLTMSTNSDGKPAERITFAWNYRKGCGCGNDQRITMTDVITARCPSGADFATWISGFSQWGC